MWSFQEVLAGLEWLIALDLDMKEIINFLFIWFLCVHIGYSLLL